MCLDFLCTAAGKDQSPPIQEMMELWIHQLMKIVNHMDGGDAVNKVMDRATGAERATSIEKLQQSEYNIAVADDSATTDDDSVEMDDDMALSLSCEDQEPGQLCAYDGQKCSIPPLPNSFLVCVHTGWVLMRCPPGTAYLPPQQICSSVQTRFANKPRFGRKKSVRIPKDSGEYNRRH